jgi:hypothetical protein
MKEKPIMLCLRCGYRNEDRVPGSPYTKRDKAHHQRCDYTMTIRYFDTETKRVRGGRVSASLGLDLVELLNN